MYRKYFKRTIDIAFASWAFVIIFPFFIAVCLLLSFSNKNGAVFFRQQRPGKNGKLFKIIKFKTMSDECDESGRLLPDENRLTPLGKLMRETSLDELPQLINVIKGDVSLVGPRPLLKEYLPLYTKEQARRHEVRPGITGWAQCHGRNTITWEKKFEHDLWYINNCSLTTDIKIIWLTIQNVILRKDISSNNSPIIGPFKGNS